MNKFVKLAYACIHAFTLGNPNNGNGNPIEAQKKKENLLENERPKWCSMS